MKLIKEILFYIIIVLILAGSINYAYQNHRDFENAHVKQAQAFLASTARAQSQSVEKYIGDVLRELETLSSSPVLKTSISSPQEKSGIEAEYYYLLQRSYRGMERLVDALYLIDARGTVINVSPFDAELLGQDFSRMADVRIVLTEHQPYTSGVFETVKGEKVIANICPVFVEDKFAGMLRALILVGRINELVGHLNEEEGIRVVITDGRGSVISYKNKEYLGMPLSHVFNSPFFNYDEEETRLIAAKMARGGQGSAKAGSTLIAYCPIKIGANSWSIAVAMDYNIIARPIVNNLRGNITFMGFIFLVFFSATIIFYRMQKKRDEFFISAATLDIINKQLHLEIKERKQIQQELQDYLHGDKKGQNL